MATRGRKAKVTIRDKGFVRIVKAISRVDGYSVKVGVPEEAGSYPPSKAHPHGGPPVWVVGMAHEYGIGVPERSFLRAAVDGNRRNLTHKLVRAAKDVANGDTPEVAMGRVGEWLADRSRELILEGDFTPLSPVTIAKKGHSDPLIETGLLYDSITSRVVPPRRRNA